MFPLSQAAAGVRVLPLRDTSAIGRYKKSGLVFFFFPFLFSHATSTKGLSIIFEDKVDFLYFRTRVRDRWIVTVLQTDYSSKPQAMASADEHLLINDQEEVSEDVLYVVKRSSEAFRAIVYVSK